MTDAGRETAAEQLLSMRVARSAMSAGTARAAADAAVVYARECGLLLGPMSKRDAVFVADRFLRRSRRNHHVYRAAVLQELRPRVGRSVVPEFRVGDSIADIALSDGDVRVFEVKSDLDDLGRLLGQLVDYWSISPFVSVVANELTSARIARDSTIDGLGLYTLSSKIGLREIRAPRRQQELLRVDRMVESLRRSEMINVVRALGSDLSSLPNTEIHRAAIDVVRGFSPQVVYPLFSNAIQRRTPRMGLVALRAMPRPMLGSLLRLNPSRAAARRLRSWLEEGA